MKAVWTTTAAIATGTRGQTETRKSVPTRKSTTDSQNRTGSCRSGFFAASAVTLNTGAPFTTTGTPMLPVSG